MQKNERHTKARMYALIDQWQTSGLSQRKFCIDHKIPKATFGYWRKKYLRDKSQESGTQVSTTGFIPVEVSSQENMLHCSSDHILISHPGGIRISCPVSASSEQLKTLLSV